MVKGRNPAASLRFPPAGRKAKTILGIDPGLAATGVGVLRIFGGRPLQAGFECIKTAAGDDFGSRLVRLHGACRKVIARYRPDVMAIERLFFSKNVKTAMGVGQAMGVIKLAAAQCRLPVIEYTPMEVKMAVTGDGSSGKSEVSRMVAKVLGLGKVPTPDDAADALAVAYCHFVITRFGPAS